MKNELVDPFQTEIWAEVGAISLPGNGLTAPFCINEIRVNENPFVLLRVLVAASNHAGVTSRLKIKQTRQLILASLFSP